MMSLHINNLACRETLIQAPEATNASLRVRNVSAETQRKGAGTIDRFGMFDFTILCNICIILGPASMLLARRKTILI